DAWPAQKLRAPGDIGVLAVGEEVGVEEAAADRDVFDHRATIQRRRRTGTEDVLGAIVRAAIELVPAAVEVSHRRSEEDAGGIDEALGKRLESGTDRKQFSGYRARAWIQLAGI